MKRILANIVEMTELMHLKHFSCKVMRRVCTVQLGFGCNYDVGGEVVQVNIAHPISCSKFNADFGAGWQKLHRSTGGTRRKVWAQTKILSLNIRYFVAN